MKSICLVFEHVIAPHGEQCDLDTAELLLEETHVDVEQQIVEFLLIAVALSLHSHLETEYNLLNICLAQTT
jgi:hypothetical protein